MKPNIIWLASYPKSGNTWIRYLLSNYFFNEEKKIDFDIKNKISKFPKDDFFKFVEDKKDFLILNPFELSKYWIPAQDKINNIRFLKTHNALLSISKNSFTDERHSLAAIHIVRDPRDVVVSYAKFLNKSYDEQIDLLLKEKLHFNFDKTKPFNSEFLGSWKFHLNSWRDGCPKMPRIIIKYEDLLDDTPNEFKRVVIFLSKLMKFSFDEDQLLFSINHSTFNFLSQQEALYGFDEQNDKNDSFFREGKKNQWKEELKTDQIKKIEVTLRNEMRELDYLE